MKTVGSILKEARLSKSITFDHIEKATRIRAKFLEAIEQDDYSTLPSLAYAKGFVKNYSEFLGLNSATVLAFFRRQTKDTTRAMILPKGVTEPLNRSWFQLTPPKFLALLLTSLVMLFLLYLGLQYRRINQPPILAIDTPKEQVVSTERKIDVLGRTDTDATVTVNGTSVLVRSDGKFFEQVTLEQGVNTITINSTSRFGKSTTMMRRITYQPQDAN